MLFKRNNPLNEDAKIARQQAHFTNREEHSSFLVGALAWHGSVSPRILKTVLIAVFYSLILAIIDMYYHELPHLSVTPFEYTGAVLGLVLVFRTNAGYDRWWEARRLWGSIVNQSRNSFIIITNYGNNNPQWQRAMNKWLISFSFATKESLRGQKNFNDIADILSEDEINELKNAANAPLFVANKIAALLNQAHEQHIMDKLLLIELEKHRGLLIDCLGGCERILKTPMPLVYAIKVRRFILTYLLLLPFSLIDQIGLMSAIVVGLVAYPLLSLDRIGLELQNPFVKKSLSHLPLETICQTIKSNALAISNSQ
jgi:putative membrane protein